MIKRLTLADCAKLSTFLDANFKADPSVGTATAPSKDFLETQLVKAPTWVCEESEKFLGVLGPAFFGERLVDGEKRTFVHFDRLVVDYALYLASPSEAIRVARELTLAAADDIQAEGPPDDILVFGLKDSRGGHWCELLGMKVLEANGSYCTWVLPFKEIWDRAKAVTVRTR
jgi:hypothetical protein